MQTSDPLQARGWFKSREIINWAIILVCFIPAVFLFQFFIHPLLVDVICIVIAFCVFFLFLHKRAIGIECPSCGRYVLTNTPWVCGVCGTKNLHVDDYPFVGRCSNKECGAEPKAYQCHHCGKLIYLTPDRQKFNFAKSVNIPVKPKPVKRSEHEKQTSGIRRNIEVKGLRVEEAELDVKLKGYNDALNPPKMKTVRERLRSRVGGKTELDDEVQRMKAEVDREFPDDPVEREKRHRLIDEEARDFL